MNIISPYAKIVNPLLGVYTSDISCDKHDFPFTKSDGLMLLKLCEYAARISHRTEDKITNLSYDKFLRFIVLEHGDFSVIEHASVSVEAVVDRGITHEWVRHRLGAYTQESTRFVNYKNKMPPSFVEPNLQGEEYQCWQDCIAHCEQSYKALVSYGVAPQLARSVFPNALASKILVTYNLRQWRLFFLMRTCAEAHPQMREVTIPLLTEFQATIPIIYEDIEPRVK